MKYIAAMLILGICVLAYSLPLRPYTDDRLFEQKYMELSAGQNAEYFELRNSMLTSKYRIEDTGITLIIFSIFLATLLKSGEGYFKSPFSKLNFIVLAVILPFVTVFGYVFDLMQGMYRQEFPHWADSLGIPLAGAPIQLIILLVWSLSHLRFLKNCEVSTHKITISKSHNYWLIFWSILTSALIVICAFYGQYWYALPGSLWLYYYLSLAEVRSNKRAINAA